MRTSAVRRNLALLVLATTSAVLLGLLVPLAALVRQSAFDRAIAAADQDARGVAVAAAVITDPGQLQRLVQATSERSSRTLGVITPEGRTVGVVPADARAWAGRTGARGGHAPYRGGEEVFVPVSTVSGDAVGRSYLPGSALREGVTTAWLALLGVAVALLALASAAADCLARWFVRPINRLIEATDRVSRGELDARVPAAGPRETVRLGITFNRLAERIGELLASERELVADLSHRLRTPITALRLDAEARPGTIDPTRLADHVSTLERTIDDIIATARQPLQRQDEVHSDLVACVRGRVTWWSALAEEQDRRATVHLPHGQIPVRVCAEDLDAAVDTLLENVFAHTDEGVAFHVAVRPRPGEGGVLSVSDEGPGLSQDLRVERGRSTRGSSGLGLDILRRTAARSGGRLSLGNRLGGGAALTVEFGPPPVGPSRATDVRDVARPMHPSET